MSTVIKAGSARDFLGLMPSMMGYSPTNSVVVVPFIGSKSAGVMRFDLPDERHQVATAASTIAGIVCRLDDADGVVVIVYTDRDASRAYPVLEAMETRLRECGLDIKDLLYVASDGYGSLAKGDEPSPLSELVPHPEAPSFRASNQAGGAALPDVDEELAAAICTAIGEWGEGSSEDEFSPDQLMVTAERLATGTAGGVGDLGQLHWYLERPMLRDVLLMTWTGGQDIGAESLIAQIEWNEHGTEIPEHLGQILVGDAERPDPDRLEQALTNVRTLLAVVPAPGAYAAAGWLAWALGRSTEADVYAQAGLAIAPEHGMCHIVAAFVHAGHLPGWAFQR